MGSPTLMNTAGPNIDLHNNNSKIALLQSQKGFFLLKESFSFPLCHHMLALEGHLIVEVFLSNAYVSSYNIK